MPSNKQQDYQDTAHYIPMYHRKDGLSPDDRKAFKMLEKRLFHEGRVVDPSFLANTDIRELFGTIGFDCLLDIDEQIFPVFVLEFYKTMRIVRNEDGSISIVFTINKQEFSLSLVEFGRIIGVPYQGVYMYSNEWSLEQLHTMVDYHAIYHTLIPEATTVRDTMFMPRASPSRVTRNSKVIYRDPFQMELSEMYGLYRKWENVVRENVVCLVGNKDHPNACLSFMIYCLVTETRFNVAYYMIKRMESVRSMDKMMLPYAMLLTRLAKFIFALDPSPQSFDHSFCNKVVVPLTEGRTTRFMVEGKRPHPPTDSSDERERQEGGEGSSSNPLGNTDLDPLDYINQLPNIPNESPEWQQTNGIFKCFTNFLRKKK